MIKNIIKIWHEILFSLEKKDVKKIISDLEINYVPISEENIDWVINLRGMEYVKQFKSQLKNGDFGYYACVENNPVAYGWIKYENSKDYFFKIGPDCCYLCRFFTCESMRGHNIYPSLIYKLIQHEKQIDKFYIDIERGNKASEHGLVKVGFTKNKELFFVRAFKVTLNPYRLQ